MDGVGVGAPAQQVDQQQDDADDEEDQHGGRQPHHLHGMV